MGKRKIIYGGISLIVLVAIVTTMILMLPKAVVATVNGEKITKDEFQIFIENNKGKAYQEVGATVESDEQVENKLKELAIEEAIESKAVQVLAKDLGLLKDISYNSLVSEMNRTNKVRKETFDKGGVVYGVVNFDLVSYHSYFSSNLILDIKKEMAKDVTAVSDEEVQQYFDSIKQTEEMPVKHKAQIFTFPYSIDPDEYKASRNNARKLADEAYTKLLEGESLESLHESYGEKSLLVEKEYSSEENINDMVMQSQVYTQLELLKPGEHSAVIEANGGFSILKVISAEEFLDKGLDELTSRIRTNLESEKYDAYLEEYKKELDVVINEEQLENLKITL